MRPPRQILCCDGLLAAVSQTATSTSRYGELMRSQESLDAVPPSYVLGPKSDGSKVQGSPASRC